MAKPLVLTGLTNQGVFVAFNHRGDLLASQGWEGVLRLWDPRTGRQLLSLQTAALPRFSLDDRHVGIGQAGRSLHAFEVASGREARVLPGNEALDRIAQGPSFDLDGRMLASRTRGGVQLWDTLAAERLADLDELAWSSVQFEADGTLLTFGQNVGVLLRWPVRREPSRRIVGPPRVVRAFGTNNGGHVSTSRDGGVLVLTDPFQVPLLISGGPFNPPRVLKPHDNVRGSAVSPDGRWAATVSHEGTDAGIFIWDVATVRRVTVLKAPLRSSMHFSPDGRWLATSMEGCKLWEVGTWKLLREFDAESRVSVFSPDGKLLACCAKDQVRLYDPATGRRLATFEMILQGTANDPTFSSDGRQLAMTDELSHSILIWDLALIRSELATMGLDWEPEGAETGDLAAVAPPASPPAPIRVEVLGGGKDDLARLIARSNARAEIERIRRLLALRLDSADSYHERSHQWAKLGLWAAAQADAEIACREREDDAHWVATVGHSAYQAGDDARALPALRRAIELDPDDLGTVNGLAQGVAAHGPGRTATRPAPLRLSTACSSRPSRGMRTTASRGLALSRLGRDAGALAMLRRVGERLPFEGLLLAPSRHRTGQTSLARQSLEAARGLA